MSSEIDGEKTLKNYIRQYYQQKIQILLPTKNVVPLVMNTILTLMMKHTVLLSGTTTENNAMPVEFYTRDSLVIYKHLYMCDKRQYNVTNT